MKFRNWPIPALLIAIGLAQMAGDLTGLLPLKAVAAATGASPAPKVFTAHRGFETYSSRFFVSWTDRAGRPHRLHLTPAVYRGVRGPYNRRNAYGAALSYAPVLQSNPATRPMHDAVMTYSFCGRSTILAELGIDRAEADGPITVELEPRQALPADHPWQLRYEVACDAK